MEASVSYPNFTRKPGFIFNEVGLEIAASSKGERGKRTNNKETENKIIAYLKSVKNSAIVNKYDEFCNRVYKTQKEVSRKRILLLLNENTIYFFVATMSKQYSLHAAYEPENEKIVEFLKEHFWITHPVSREKPELFYAERLSDITNNYIWDIPAAVLEAILASIVCDAEGVPYYKEFKKKKSSGGYRTIYAPDERIKSALRKVNKILQGAYDSRNEDFQVAYKEGKNILSNAIPHKNQNYAVKIDISDFFPSCKKERVEHYIDFMFRGIINEKTKKRFMNIITINDGLFIGSPVSGTLANTIISKPVQYVKRCCDHCGIVFTVYADDMTFSSGTFINKELPEKLFKTAFAEYGMESDFTINSKKTHGMIGCKRHITGVSFNGENEPVVKRLKYRELRTFLDYLEKGKEISIPMHVLKGRFSFITSVDRSEKMRALIKRYEATIVKYNLLNIAKYNEKGGV